MQYICTIQLKKERSVHHLDSVSKYIDSFIRILNALFLHENIKWQCFFVRRMYVSNKQQKVQIIITLLCFFSYSPAASELNVASQLACSLCPCLLACVLACRFIRSWSHGNWATSGPLLKPLHYVLYPSQSPVWSLLTLTHANAHTPCTRSSS